MKPAFIVVALSVAGTGFARPSNEGDGHPKDLTRRDPILSAITTGASLVSGLFGKKKKKGADQPKAERMAFDANTCLCNDVTGAKSTEAECHRCCDARGYADSIMACKSNCGLIPADIGQGKIGLACTEQYIAAPAPAAAPAGGSTAPGTQPGSMLGSDPNALAAGGRTDNRALPADDPNIVPWSGYNRGLPQSSTDYTGTQYGGNARSPYGNSAIQNGGNNGRYSQASDLNSSPYGQGNRFENMAFQSSPTDQTNAGIDRYGVPGNQRSSFESGLRAPQAESVDPSGYAQYYQDTANAGNSLANADQRRIEQSQGNDGVRQTDSSPSMGSGSSGIPDDTESPEGAKPLDTESPEGAKPADTESPEGAKPLDTESPEGAKPLDTESPEGAKPADTESPEGAKPPDTESPEGAEPVDTDSTEGAKPDADGEGSTPPTTNDDASPDASQDPIVPQTNGDDSQPTLPDGPANDDTSLTPSPISKTDYGGSADSTYGGFPGEKLSSTRTTPLSPREKFLANEAAKLRNVAAGAAAARQSVIAAAAASSEAATAAAAQKDAEDAAWKTQKDLEMSQIRDCSQKRKRKSLKFDKKACRKCCTKIDYLPGTPNSTPLDKHDCYQGCVDSKNTLQD